MEERLQKILARAGYGSRRSSEELISAGRVMVNNVRATLGTKADLLKDTVTVDGRPIPKTNPEKIYIALHKPRGVLSDVDPKDSRPTVRDLVPVPGHLFSVGRLDYDSEGLILLTNDGDLANRLTHPRYGHEKEYRVLVAARPDLDQLIIWRRGVVLEDGYRTQPAQVSVEGEAGKGAWLRVILHEGRKRQIRETGTRIGLPVQRIIRMRIGSLELGDLKPREWRNLTMEEVRRLMTQPARKHARAEQAFRRPMRPGRTGGPEKPAAKRPSRPARQAGERPAERSHRPAEDRDTERPSRPASPSGYVRRGQPPRPAPSRRPERPSRPGEESPTERPYRPARPARPSGAGRSGRPSGPSRPARPDSRPRRPARKKDSS